MMAPSLAADRIKLNELAEHIEVNRLTFESRFKIHKERIKAQIPSIDTTNKKFMRYRDQINYNRNYNTIRDQEMENVSKDNQSLVKHLMDIATEHRIQDPDADPSLNPHHQGSLNRKVRWDTSKEIERKNRAMAHRIITRSANIDRKQQEKDYRRHAYLVKHMSKTGYLKYKTASSSSKTSRLKGRRSDGDELNMLAQTSRPSSARAVSAGAHIVRNGKHEEEKTEEQLQLDNNQNENNDHGEDEVDLMRPPHLLVQHLPLKNSKGGRKGKAQAQLNLQNLDAYEQLNPYMGVGGPEMDASPKGKALPVWKQSMYALERELGVGPMPRNVRGDYVQPTRMQARMLSDMNRRDFEIMQGAEYFRQQHLMEQEQQIYGDSYEHQDKGEYVEGEGDVEA